MILPVTAGYLWLPVCEAAPVVKLHIYASGEKIREADIALDPEQPDYDAAMDLRFVKGQEIDVRGDVPDAWLKRLSFHDSPPEPSRAARPVFHFTADTGWINDPNGLVYAEGIWHLYHQWNPYGTEWGNMHWGHAVSRDLITWEKYGEALAPDEFGTVYSGCGWPDRRNAAGFGPDALLYFYTAAGGRNQWSADAGNRHTQRLAVSLDGGRTLEKKMRILDHIKGENRDPKVFYHAASSAYIMVLYLDGNEFAVFRSRDLLHWAESQRFTAETMWECPDLLELTAENGETRWVFWSASGAYMIGHFDGFRFEPESELLHAYDTDLPYAAQTYPGVADRIISIAWLRTRNSSGHFRGMMSVPLELSLARAADGYRVRLRPVRELRNCFKESGVILPEKNPAEIPLSGKPALLRITWAGAQPGAIRMGKTALQPRNESKETMILLDHGIIEYFDLDGLVYGAVEAEETAVTDRVQVSGAQTITVSDYLSPALSRSDG